MTKVIVLILAFVVFPILFEYILVPNPPFITLPQPTPIPLPKLNLTTVFADDHSGTQKLDPKKTVTIIATGDIIPARVTNIMAVQKNDFNWAFLNIAPILKNSDLTFINLETPLVTNCPLINDGFKFCGDVRHLQGLLSAGVDVVSLANNHTSNFGTEGVLETKQLLEKNNIGVTGVDGPFLKEIKGIKFAFLGYNDVGRFAGVSQADDEKICTEIKDLRPKADVIIVEYHWGIEYQPQPDARQKQLGHLTIDCGADLVIGNHPHWIQPIEFYHNKLITYAHGNTIFDQEWSQKTKEGVIGKYTFFNNQLVDVEYLPLVIENFGQPHFLEGEAKQKILQEMENQSHNLELGN